MEKYILPGYEGIYTITKCGRIFSEPRVVRHNWGGPKNIDGKEKCVHKTKAGYYATNLSRDGVTVLCYIHRLLAQTFIENPDEKKTVNHRDGNKLNNSLENIEWATQSEQNFHAYHIGLKKRRSLLTEADVQEIRSLLIQGLSQSSVAKKFSVTRSCIQSIHNGSTWANLPFK